MQKILSRSAVAVLLTVVVGACAAEADDAAGDPADAPPIAGQVPPEMGGPPPLSEEDQQRQMMLITELQSIDQRLQPLQAQAFEDPTITAQQDALAEQVEAAMEEAVPGSSAKREEFDGLLAAYQSAQQAGDQQKLAELTPKLQTLDMELGQVQMQVAERPEIQSAIEEFQDNLAAKMAEIDPESADLLERREELTTELQEMMGAPGS